MTGRVGDAYGMQKHYDQRGVVHDSPPAAYHNGRTSVQEGFLMGVAVGLILVFMSVTLGKCHRVQVQRSAAAAAAVVLLCVQLQLAIVQM